MYLSELRNNYFFKNVKFVSFINLHTILFISIGAYIRKIIDSILGDSKISYILVTIVYYIYNGNKFNWLCYNL